MWQKVRAQHVPSPHVEAPQRPRLDDSQLADLFNNATSPERCALAAKSYAENPLDLGNLLIALPGEVQSVTLYRHLASELATADIRDWSIWRDLLIAISTASQYAGVAGTAGATPQETFELMQGCARSLASLKVDFVDLWSAILETVQESHHRDPNLPAVAAIAREMTNAGIEEEVLWNRLVGVFTDPRSPDCPYADVGDSLKNAGVDCALAWRLLRDTMEKDKLAPPSVRTAFYQVLFSAEPTPLDISALIRQFGASSLISKCKTKDLAIWKRVIDAALHAGAVSDAAKACAANSPSRGVWEYLLSKVDSYPDAEGCDASVRVRAARGLALSTAHDPVDWQGVIDGAVQEGASGLPDGDFSGLTSLLDYPINHEPKTLISTLRGILVVGLQTRERYRRLICQDIREHVASDKFVAAWESLRGDVLLDPLIRLVLGKAFEHSAAFARLLGAKNAFFVIVNLHTTVPAEQRSVYRSMLESALTNGTQGLDGIEAVRAHRDLLRKRAPSINWEAVFHPNAARFPTQTFYSSFPELQTNVDAFLKSLKVLVLEIGAYTHVLHRNGVARNAPERAALRDVTARLIRIVAEPNTAMVQLWGQGGEKDIHVDQALLSRLIRHGTLNEDAARDLEKAVSMLALQTSPDVFGPKVAEVLEWWNRLERCVVAPGFPERYGACGDYRVVMLDPDDVANLMVGYEVSSCLAPDGKNSGDLFARLAGGWLLWAVKNPQGQTAAIAWGVLSEECELVIDFIDERVNFRAPPRGNNLLEQLIAFAPVVAKTVNAQAAWLAPARYGRLEKFPAFVDRTTEKKLLYSLVPDFLGEQTYTDSINQGKLPYSRLM